PARSISPPKLVFRAVLVLIQSQSGLTSSRLDLNWSGIRGSSGINMNLVSRLVKRPSEEEIVVPFRAVLATKRPQEHEWKNDHFEQAPAVRASHVRAPAKG